ncbi:sigma-70 family RNA polymerase sigma factor [Cytobacillus sp. Hm23]
MDFEQLVKRAQKYDDEAFYELISLHKMSLYKIAYSYFRNEHDATEAVQEVTFRAYKEIKKVRQPQFFTTWITRIMINYCSREYSRKKKTSLQEVDKGVEDSESATLTKIDLEQHIALLDPQLQTIVKLKYYHDLTIGQIADILKCPEGTVKTRLYKSLKLLKVSLAKEWLS